MCDEMDDDAVTTIYIYIYIYIFRRVLFLGALGRLQGPVLYDARWLLLLLLLFEEEEEEEEGSSKRFVFFYA